MKTQQQITGLPQGVTHVSPVYPVAQPESPAPVALTPRLPFGIVAGAIAGGLIAWMGASGFYGAADVQAMQAELNQARADLVTQQQWAQQQSQAMDSAREVLGCP